MSHYLIHGVRKGVVSSAPKQYMTDFVKGIKTSDLPDNFRDAVRIVQGMNMHYLWVDALCMVYDDPEDFRQQTTKLADIFGGA
jgi:acyl carrier protein phosphodiesterase